MTMDGIHCHGTTLLSNSVGLMKCVLFIVCVPFFYSVFV